MSPKKCCETVIYGLIHLAINFGETNFDLDIITLRKAINYVSIKKLYILTRKTRFSQCTVNFCTSILIKLQPLGLNKKELRELAFDCYKLRYYEQYSYRYTKKL